MYLNKLLSYIRNGGVNNSYTATFLLKGIIIFLQLIGKLYNLVVELVLITVESTRIDT